MKIKCINGKIEIPKEFELNKNKKRLHIKTPYMVRVDRLDKNCFQVSTQQWFRRKGIDKPYINEGLISIDGFIYVIEDLEKEKKQDENGK